MIRLLALICLVCAVVALAGVAVSALTRAAADSRALASGLLSRDKGKMMERVAYIALILLMLGVTSGLLGGL